MYPTTRESVIADISSSVAENAVCWCDGRKKRRRRIVCRLTHLGVGRRVIGGLESGKANSISVTLTRLSDQCSYDQRPVQKRPHPSEIEKSEGHEIEAEFFPAPMGVRVTAQREECGIDGKQIAHSAGRGASRIDNHLQNHGQGEKFVFDTDFAAQAERQNEDDKTEPDGQQCIVLCYGRSHRFPYAHPRRSESHSLVEP